MAATASIARSAASIINFFNFYPFSSVILAESFTIDRNYTRRSGLLYTFFKISSPILSPGAEKMAPRKAQRLQRCARAALLGIRARTAGWLYGLRKGAPESTRVAAGADGSQGLYLDLSRPLLRDTQGLGDLAQGAALGAVEAMAHVQGAGVIRDGAGNGLPYPPRSVRREAVA